jgi:hypothetical protein
VKVESTSSSILVSWNDKASYSTLWMVDVKPRDVAPRIISGTSVKIEGLKSNVNYQFIITSNSGYGSWKFFSPYIKYTGSTEVEVPIVASFLYDPNVVISTLFQVGVPVTVTPLVSCNSCLQSFSVSPPLPAGLVLDRLTGEISGVPTMSRNLFTYTVAAEVVGNQSKTRVNAIISFAVQRAEVIEEEIQTDGCSSHPCKNAATCVQSGTIAFSCICSRGWGGSTCEVNINGCEKKRCGDHGTCIDKHPNDFSGEFSCVCDKDWTGDTCNKQKSICERTICSNNSECKEVDGVGLCVCPLGVSGPQCRDFMSCSGLQCNNGGVPVKSIKNGSPSCSCKCSGNYSGENCDTIKIDLNTAWTVSNLKSDEKLGSSATYLNGNLNIIHRKFGYSELFVMQSSVMLSVDIKGTYAVNVQVDGTGSSAITQLDAMLGTTLPSFVIDLDSLVPIGGTSSDLTLGNIGSNGNHVWTGSINCDEASSGFIALRIAFKSTLITNSVRISSITLKKL